MCITDSTVDEERRCTLSVTVYWYFYIRLFLLYFFIITFYYFIIYYIYIILFIILFIIYYIFYYFYILLFDRLSFTVVDKMPISPIRNGIRYIQMANWKTSCLILHNSQRDFGIIWIIKKKFFFVVRLKDAGMHKEICWLQSCLLTNCAMKLQKIDDERLYTEPIAFVANGKSLFIINLHIYCTTFCLL